MKYLLVLALATAMAAAIRYPEYYPESIKETIFRPGVEYIYRYESEVLTGIRSVSDQLSGVKIHCIVKLQIHRDGTTLLKMHEVNVFKVNNGVSRVERYETVPEHLLTRLTGEQAEVMVEQLVKPIKFRFIEGEVRDVKTDPTDKYWSINIKKGLLSLLQVKLNGRSSIIDSEPSTSSYLESSFRPRNRFYDIVNPLGHRSRFGVSRPIDNMFKVMELDVNGECETKYYINSKPSVDYSSVSDMVVTKIKDFDNCLKRNSFEEGIFAGLPHYNTERKLVQPAVESEYVLSGDRHHFLIKKARLEAGYMFKPYGPEGGQISAHIIQKLFLMTTTEIQTPIAVNSEFVSEKLGLQMEIPRADYINPDSSIYGQVHDEWQYKQIIDRKLSQLLSTIYPTMHETSAAELMQLSLIVRYIPPRQLYSIVKSYVSSSESPELSKKGEILLDILPTIPTPEVAKVVIDLIRDQTITGIRARLSLGAISLVVTPTPEVVKTIFTLYKEGTSLERETPLLRQTALLSVGTVCNKMINRMRRVNKPIPEFMSTIEEISSELISELEQSQTETHKLMVLKAMGNMGAKELIMPIKSIIDDKSLPVVIRSQAIFALRKLAKPFPKEVHPILLSVLLDREQPDSVRAPAFIVLKKSQPSFITLQLITHSLRTEPSRQIKTLIYSSLVNLATFKNHIPELVQTTRDARKVLKLTRAIPVGLFDSKDMTMHLYSETLDIGTKLNAWSLKSKLTGLPKSVVGSMYTTIFGNRLHLAEAGIEGKGFETVLRRLLGPYGLLKDIVRNKASLYELLKPLTTPEMSMMSEKIREFIGRRSFVPRMEEEIKGVMYGEILGHEMFYREFNTELVERLMNFAVMTGPRLLEKLSEGINVNTLKTLTMVANSLVMPTPMGIPLSLNVSAAAVLKLEGMIKANSLPTVSDFLMRRPFMSKKIEIVTDIKPSVSMEVFGYMGVDMKWLRTGTAIKANVVGSLPIKGEVHVDPIDSKVTIKYDPPTHSVHLITAKIEPVNFIYYVPKTFEKLPFEFELTTIHSHESIRSSIFEKNFRVPMLSSSWNVKAEFTHCMTTWCSYYPLNGRQHITVTYTPLDMNSRKELVIKIKKYSQNMYNEEGIENEFLPSTRSPYMSSYRTERREMSSWDEFEPVELVDIIASPRKVELLVEMAALGFRSDKRVNAKITWVAESNYLEHQLNVQIVGVETEDVPKFKLMLNGMLRCPLTISHLSHYVQSGEVLGKLDVHWGWNSFTENTIKCKVWEMNSMSWKNELIKESVEHYLPNDYLSLTPKIFNYGVEIEFPHINYVAKKYIALSLDLLKKLMYSSVKVAIPENIVPNKIVVLGQYVTKLEKFSVIIKTPRETNFLLDLPLTSPWSTFSLPTLHDFSPLDYYTNYTRLDMDQFQLPEFDSYKSYDTEYTPSWTGVCKVHSDKLMTFDGVPIVLPIYTSETPSSRCNILLAQDCSERGLFAVSSSFKLGRWTVKMIVPSYEIELIPMSSSMSSEVTVLVNGQPMRVSSSMPVELPSLTSSSEPVCVVEKITEGLKVKLVELGLTVVLTESNKIFITMSPLSSLQGRLCGLCGNNNYDTSDDMTSLDNKLMPTSRLFVMDNVLPSTYCDANDYERTLNIRHESYCKKEKTMKIERTLSGVEEICFSSRPVPVCRSHCVTESTIPRSISFVCTPRHHAEHLIRKHRIGVTILPEEIESLPSTSTFVREQVELAEKCVSTF